MNNLIAIQGWLYSGMTGPHSGRMPLMAHGELSGALMTRSAFGPKADMPNQSVECPLMTLSERQDVYSDSPAWPKASNSSIESWISVAATFSSRCSTFEVPGMGSITGLRLSTHARAIWLGAAWCFLATESRIEPC